MKNQPSPADEKGFAVLELFTSQGCSSCPPADELIEIIQQEYQDKPVYILAFHVDYWDKQGWKDVFSSAEYTKRQMEYGDRLSNGTLYTPQLVVNGKFEFVGSDESNIREAISGVLATRYSTTLTIKSSLDDDNLVLNYHAVNAPKNSYVQVAVIQKSAKTKVERGENGGLLLSHVQIVRKLHVETINEEGKGIVKFRLPGDFDADEWELISMIQNSGSGEILAASRVKL